MLIQVSKYVGIECIQLTSATNLELLLRPAWLLLLLLLLLPVLWLSLSFSLLLPLFDGVCCSDVFVLVLLPLVMLVLVAGLSAIAGPVSLAPLAEM